MHVLFAGETEEQYLATEALVRAVGFDRVNTAAYSPRPNTPAADWDNQVADLIKAVSEWFACGHKAHCSVEASMHV